MSRKRERYLWQAGIVFVLSCLALVLDETYCTRLILGWLSYRGVLCCGSERRMKTHFTSIERIEANREQKRGAA